MSSSRATKTVRVKEDTWVDLHDRKEPGETMDDVISDAISEYDGDESGGASPQE